jgi:hypothetical protein
MLTTLALNKKVGIYSGKKITRCSELIPRKLRSLYLIEFDGFLAGFLVIATTLCAL